MNKISKYFSILLGFFLILFVFKVANLHSQSKIKIKSVEIKEDRILGQSNDYYFGRVMDVDTDSKGNMYVADGGSMTIKVLDKSDSLLREIGRRGRGPGEFLSFQEFYVNNQDELLIADLFNFRITKMSRNGEVMDTYLMSKETQDIAYFKDITQLPSNNYLVLFKRYDYELAKMPNTLFHIWDSNFKKVLYEFGSFSNLKHANDFGTEINKFGIGSIALFNNQTFVFAPNVYHGFIYVYLKKKGKFSLSKKIKGYDPPGPSSVTVESKDGNGIHAAGKVINGYIFAYSAGIYTMNNELIVHFTMLRKPDKEADPGRAKWVLGVELFDKNFNYLGYYTLKNFSNISFHPAMPIIRTDDANDNFYMIITEKGTPVIHKFSLNISYY